MESWKGRGHDSVVRGCGLRAEGCPAEMGIALITFTHLPTFIGWLAGNYWNAWRGLPLVLTFIKNLYVRIILMRVRYRSGCPLWSLHVLITWLPSQFTLYWYQCLGGRHRVIDFSRSLPVAAIPWDRTMFMLLTNFLTFSSLFCARSFAGNLRGASCGLLRRRARGHAGLHRPRRNTAWGMF